MGLFGFPANKCKTQCKMCISRIKLMRNKRQIMLRNLRKEVAELLKQGKQGNARIRVEAVLREELTLRAYDILELFLELISVRVPLMEKAKEMPPDMMEAICTAIYAGDRMSTDLPEMAVIRNILISKYAGVYGKEFAAEASSELTCRKWHVNESLVSCLVIEAPSPQEKIRILSEIAAEYGVEFDEEAAAADMLTGAVARPAAGVAGYPEPTPGSGAYAAPYGVPPPWAAQATAGAPGTPPPVPGFGPPPAAAPPGVQPPLDVASTLTPRVPGAPAEPPSGPGWAPPAQPASQPADGFPGHITNVAAYLNAKRGGSPPPRTSGGQGGYEDATSAAAAAREYSTKAQQAAEAAEQYARSQQGGPQPPASPPAGSGSGGGGSGGVQVLGGGYVKRSDSEIQRAYDAAAGPPSKGELAAAGPPSAPPVVPAAAPPTAGGIAGGRAADGAAGAAASDDLGLPNPPTAGARLAPGAGGAGEGNEVDRELEELTRRFEALKRR